MVNICRFLSGHPPPEWETRISPQYIAVAEKEQMFYNGLRNKRGWGGREEIPRGERTGNAVAKSKRTEIHGGRAMQKEVDTARSAEPVLTKKQAIDFIVHKTKSMHISTRDDFLYFVSLIVDRQS